MLLAEVVATSRQVAETRARSAKIERLATLLRAATHGEVRPLVGMLAGAPRQGRIGLGPSQLWSAHAAPSSEPRLSVGEVDAMLSAIGDVVGRVRWVTAHASSGRCSNARPRPNRTFALHE
jgi:DNA ligase-1